LEGWRTKFGKKKGETNSSSSGRGASLVQHASTKNPLEKLKSKKGGKKKKNPKNHDVERLGGQKVVH